MPVWSQPANHGPDTFSIPDRKYATTYDTNNNTNRQRRPMSPHATDVPNSSADTNNDTVAGSITHNRNAPQDQWQLKQFTNDYGIDLVDCWAVNCPGHLCGQAEQVAKTKITTKTADGTRRPLAQHVLKDGSLFLYVFSW